MKDIELVDIYLPFSPHVSRKTMEFLFMTLGERDERANISHRRMPDYEEHRSFVLSHPYRDWWVAQKDGVLIGTAYLTQSNEIGLFIREEHRRQGNGSAVIDAIIAARGQDEPLYANVSPQNEPSMLFFEKKGFCHIQNTLRRDPESV